MTLPLDEAFHNWSEDGHNYAGMKYRVKDRRHAEFKRWCKMCLAARYQLVRTDETLYQCAICERFVCEERK